MTKNWMIKAESELRELSKDELIQRIISERGERYSKAGKKNVSTSKAHERRCKKLLFEWSGTEFRRRRVTGRGDDTLVVEGVADVIPVEGESRFAIESKKGEKFSLNALFSNPGTAVFTQWWHQCSWDAKILSERSGRQKWPFLFFKPQPSMDWVAFPSQLIQDATLTPPGMVGDHDGWNIRCLSDDGIWFPAVKFDAYLWHNPITMNVSTSDKNKIMEPLDLEPCYMCRWRDFASNVDPQCFFEEDGD